MKNLKTKEERKGVFFFKNIFLIKKDERICG